MKFTKMQGLGNDYLYHFGELTDARSLAVKLSDRHFGIGSDGIITISKSESADFHMRIFNADGSEAKMCGNGIRCVGKYVYDRGYTQKTELTIETASGIKTLQLHIKDDTVETVTVAMGQAIVDSPAALSVLDQTITCIPVDMGNPHAVIFTDDAEQAPLTTIGAALEKHDHFPGGVNVEFVQILSPTELRMRVWERGSGITMACGTGSCASAAAAVARGCAAANTPITVHLDGGDLVITLDDSYQVQMTGPAAFVCDCEVYHV